MRLALEMLPSHQPTVHPIGLFAGIDEKMVSLL